MTYLKLEKTALPWAGIAQYAAVFLCFWDFSEANMLW